MKALTLTQPWASLVAHGLKQWETRSWQTSYRGPLAIHAAKTFPADARRFALGSRYVAQMCGGDPIIGPTLAGMVLGAVVAVCDLVEIVPADFAPDEREQELGNWLPWRWAWRLDNVRRIGPYYVHGQQGLWDWPRPPSSSKPEET